MSSGAAGISQRIERAGADRAHERGAFEQFVARRDVKNPLRLRADPVTRSADALQRNRDGARRAELNDEIDRADVDAQLERCRRYDRAQLACPQPSLDVEAHFARETAVVRHDETFAETLVQRKGDALAHPPRADEDQGRAMGSDLLGDAVVDLAPHLLARDGTEFVGGNLARRVPSRADGRR